jgi:NADH dehydrogenase (ubiquinone) 1 beta subcomplex subunit 5
MEFIPTNFEWRKFKDHMNFYFMLGLVPIGVIIGAVNLFIGPGELIDTPEGYEPKHWEYYKSPISRFISRYLIDSQEKWYERHMHFIALEKEKILMRKLEKKVSLLVGDAEHRHDSKRWYYLPSNDKAAVKGRLVEEITEEGRGYK